MLAGMFFCVSVLGFGVARLHIGDVEQFLKRAVHVSGPRVRVLAGVGELVLGAVD